jgi:transposase
VGVAANRGVLSVVSVRMGVVMSGEHLEVCDALWVRVEPLLPAVPARRFRYPGRKRIDDRACLEGILYVLRWGVPWRVLPVSADGPSGGTCWRRFRDWTAAGVWDEVHRVVVAELDADGRLDLSRALVDSSDAKAKKGARKPGVASKLGSTRPAIT